MSNLHPTTGDPFLDEALSDVQSNSSGNDAKTGGNVVVVCRVRPFNRREIEIQDEMNSHFHNEWERKPLRSVVEMEGGDTVFLDHNNNYAERQRFPFDISFWSVPPEQQLPGANPVAEQVDLYRQVGVPIIKNVWSGFNSCVFAYGQTGSGKTHSVLGPPQDFGLIPRICQGLFASIERKRQEDALDDTLASSGILKSYKMNGQFFEIYNERVKDLLWALRTPSDDDASIDRENIKVRHLGNEISLIGLTTVEVDSAEDCMRLIEEGSKNRSVGATKMNDQSSRSHSIFRLTFSQITRVLPKDKFEKPKVYSRVSTVSLVDLAGSERMKKTGAEGQRLKEAVAINQSLTTLKNVIDALVENRSVIPYRDSTLTWILSDNLGGNSKTFMIACVSPHYDNAEETLNTLRYALRTQAVVCHATVNESDELKRMNRMKEELERLQQQYADGAGDSDYVTLKMKQSDLNQLAERTKEQAEEAAREEARTKRDLDAGCRRRYNIAFRGAFHRVFQKRVDLAYTAYFARDGATLAGLKREVDSYRGDSSSTDKELSDLRAEERRTASALKNSESELARQRDRMENTQAALRELDKSEAKNAEEIQRRQERIPKSLHVSKQVIQRRLLDISFERERVVRTNTAQLDVMKDAWSTEIESLRQERAQRLEPLSQRETTIHAAMARADQEHKKNMEKLKERLTQLQSSCVFVENENKRSAIEVDEAILQGNKDRFEAFASSESESKKKLQEFQVHSKAALAAELEAMRLNLSEGQSKHDRQIDRILEKTRDDVLRTNRESEVRASHYQSELKSRLGRFESLNSDAGQCLRSAKAAQKRYSDVFVRVMHVLAGAAPPEINTADEMDSVEEVIKKLQHLMGLTSSSSSAEISSSLTKPTSPQQDISGGGDGSFLLGGSSPYQHQSHSPLAFRAGASSIAMSQQRGGGAGQGGGHSRSTSQTPSHAASVTSSGRNQVRHSSGGVAVTPGRNVKFADPNNLTNNNISSGSGSKLRPSSSSSSSGQRQRPTTSPTSPTTALTFEPPPVLQRKPPPVYQTATSKIRQAYAQYDKQIAEARYQQAAQERPFSPRVHISPQQDSVGGRAAGSSSSLRELGSSPATSPRAGTRSLRNSAVVTTSSNSPFSKNQNSNSGSNNSSNKTKNQEGTSPAHHPHQPWNSFDNYYGYKSVSTNEEPVLYSQRVVIEGSVIAMRTHSGPSEKRGLSPNRASNSNNNHNMNRSSPGRGLSPVPTTPRRY